MKSKRKTLKKFIDPQRTMQAYVSAYTVILSILMTHINRAFSVHDDKHRESPLLLPIQYGTMRHMYVCLFLYLVHLLYHEVGLKYECCWSFLVTLTVCGVTFVPGETAGPSVFPLSAMLFPKPRLILRNPLQTAGEFYPFIWTTVVCFCMLPILTERNGICLWCHCDDTFKSSKRLCCSSYLVIIYR